MKKELSILSDLISAHKQLPVFLELGFERFDVLINGSPRSFNKLETLTEEISMHLDDVLDLLDSGQFSSDEIKFLEPLYFYWYNEELTDYLNDRKLELLSSSG